MLNISWLNLTILILAAFCLTHLISFEGIAPFSRKPFLNNLYIGVLCSLIVVCTILLLPTAFPFVLILAVAGAATAIQAAIMLIRKKRDYCHEKEMEYKKILELTDDVIEYYRKKENEYTQKLEQMKEQLIILKSIQAPVTSVQAPPALETANQNKFKEPITDVQAPVPVEKLMRSRPNESVMPEKSAAPPERLKQNIQREARREKVLQPEDFMKKVKEEDVTLSPFLRSYLDPSQENEKKQLKER